MSIAYHVAEVQVCEVHGLAGLALADGSRWRTGNLLFRAPEAGETRRLQAAEWALAIDGAGRGFIIWSARHPRALGLVIQPLDSQYCYELHPACPVPA
ncbi:MAG: hypothetical protein V1797_18895 [Pseudomonadota bacterium]